MNNLQTTITKTLPKNVNKTASKLFNSILPKNVSKAVEKNIFNNKYVLYVVLFFAISNVIGYIFVEDYYSLAFFVLVGMMMSYITKNMTINLMVTIFLTNVFMAQKVVRETFKNSKNDKNTKQNKKNVKEGLRKKTHVKEGMKQNTKGKDSENDEVDDDSGYVNYSKTMEKSYENLGNMLGSDGIKNLTKDTDKLMKQQEKLMESLEGMAPLFEKATSLMDKVGGLQNYASNLGSMFGGSTPKKDE